jgi:hypothetical protein
VPHASPPTQPRLGWEPNGEGNPLACLGARLGQDLPAIVLTFARIPSASSAALERISSASFIAASRWATARSSRTRLLSTASWRKVQPSSSSARSAARALVIPSR